MDAGLSTSWQLDLFGKVERSVDAARAFYLSSRAEAEALVHALIAELAQRRIALSILNRRLQFVMETVESRKLTLETVERRYHRGADDTSAGDVYLARENLASAESDLPNLRARLTEQAYALAVLLGLEPGAIDQMETEIPLLPPHLKTPVGVPARLLDR